MTAKVTDNLQYILGALGLVALICATVLAVTDHDATAAWAAFGTIVGLIGGQYLPKPGR